MPIYSRFVPNLRRSESRRFSCKKLGVRPLDGLLGARLPTRSYDNDADWRALAVKPATTSAPPAPQPPAALARTSETAGIPPPQGGTTLAATEGHVDVLDSRAPAPLVMVAVGHRQHLGDR